MVPVFFFSFSNSQSNTWIILGTGNSKEEIIILVFLRVITTLHLHGARKLYRLSAHFQLSYFTSSLSSGLRLCLNPNPFGLRNKK